MEGFGMSAIENFVQRLSNQPVLECVTNPYLKPDIAKNLHAYLSLLLTFPYSGHLLVGEAPGYKGCTQCGVPFTSQRVINERTHPFLVKLRSLVTVNGNATEITATKVWNQLEGKSSVPAFWNTFPFHPYQPGDPTRNRMPSREETAIGITYLDEVIQILKPHTIVAVGSISATLLQNRYPSTKFRTFSHPSMRGYPGFVSGFSALQLT